MYDHVAVIGASGLVGQTLIQLLEERQFLVKQLYPLASTRSQGKTILFRNQPISITSLDSFDFSKASLAFFCASAACSAEYVPKAVKSNCWVIDNSAEFRSEPDIPLIVPEVNMHTLDQHAHRRIIANPNCSTIQLVVALKPLYDLLGIHRINITTYQSVSGAGIEAVHALDIQSKQILNQEPVQQLEPFTVPIGFNVIPHIDLFQDNDYTKEEMKLVIETKKILNDDQLFINPTAVRVPVYVGHSEAVHVETKTEITHRHIQELKIALSKAPGVCLIDKKNHYPTARSHAVDHDSVFVGRIRKDISSSNGINLWIVADNLRKGAALNAIQIAEQLVAKF